jgi:hypothetical protein
MNRAVREFFGSRPRLKLELIWNGVWAVVFTVWLLAWQPKPNDTAFLWFFPVWLAVTLPALCPNPPQPQHSPYKRRWRNVTDPCLAYEGRPVSHRSAGMAGAWRGSRLEPPAVRRTHLPMD